MSEILDKNLRYLKERNPVLVEKILSVKEFSKSFEINTNLVGEYNLLIDGVPVHSVTGVEEEAKEFLSKLENNTASSINVIYGLGLGYLCDVYAQNTNGYVVVFEQDIEALRYVLEIVDFSEAFSTNRVFFVSSVDEFQQFLLVYLRYKTKLTVSALDYYTSSNNYQYDFVYSEIQRVFNLVSHNFNFQISEIADFLNSTTNLLHLRLIHPLLNDSAGAFKDKPALIVSAGPSLAKNIEFIKKYRDNFVVFCVSTALKTLLDNGITPDFLNIIDKVDTSVHFDFEQTKDVFSICESFTHQQIFKKLFRGKFITCSEEMETSHWFLGLKGRTVSDSYFETKGTVAYHALFSAYTLGCNPIVLIGQDLAYPNGDCYTKGSKFDTLKCKYNAEQKKYVIEPENYEAFRDAYAHNADLPIEKKNRIVDEFLAKANEDLKTVVGQNGEMLPTSAAYALFIYYLSTFGKNYGKDLKLFNCSVGGAQIDNFENCNIETVAKNYASSKLDKEQLFENLVRFNDVDYPLLVKNIKNEVKAMEDFVLRVKSVLPFVEKAKKEFNNKKLYSPKAQENLEAALNLYIKIYNELLYKYKILAILFAKEISVLSYQIKEYKTQVSNDITQEIMESLLQFCTLVPARVEMQKQKLVGTISVLEKMHESSIAKS